MHFSVVVPSYRRPEDLGRCLHALRLQTRAPNEVLVVLRADDAESNLVAHQMGEGWRALRVIHVDRPGVVAALNAGVAAAEGDVVAFTDDDAVPRTDWLGRIEAHFEGELNVGGVGGRDVQPGIHVERADVGRVQWFGRVIGNHHVGSGLPRDVDVLKGVNCAFRTRPLRRVGLDERLLGAGAQVHWELALCLGLRRAGWRLIYDPAIIVRHNVAPRHDADQLHRGRFDEAPQVDAVHNETLALAEHLPPLRRAAFVAWAALVGTASEPGLAQLPRVFARDGRTAFARWRATQRGRLAGLRAAHRDVSAAATAPASPAKTPGGR